MTGQAPYWVPTKMWPEQAAFILGGGPSLYQQNLELLHNKNVIGCNDAYGLGSWIDVVYFGDNPWLDEHRERLKSFKGVKVSCTSSDPLDSDIKWMLRWPVGLCGGKYRKDRVGWNASTGASAINLAMLLGATTIVLVGFDMRFIDGESNWHSNNVSVVREADYNLFIQGFERIKLDLDERFPQIRVINATPGSAMNTFPIMTLEEAINVTKSNIHTCAIA